MNNAILDKLYSTRMVYCHVLELSHVEDLKDTIETLVDEFSEEGHSNKDIIEFFDTITLYYYVENEEEEDKEDEEALYDFDINSYVLECIEEAL